MIRMMCSDISVLGRVTSGVKLMNLDKDISVASIAKVRESSNKTEEDMLKSLEKDLEEDGDKTEEVSEGSSEEIKE